MFKMSRIDGKVISEVSYQRSFYISRINEKVMISKPHDGNQVRQGIAAARRAFLIQDAFSRFA